MELAVTEQEPIVHKGIDDLLLAGLQPDIIEGEQLDNFIADLKAMDCDDNENSTSGEDVTDNTIRNGEVVIGDDEKEEFFPYSMEEILANIDTITHGWPKRVETALFIKSYSGSDSVSWLMNADSFIGWLGTISGSPPEFRRAANCHTPAHVYQELKRSAESFVAVETLPHEPPMKGHFYCCGFPEPGDGSKLNELVSRYNPETDIDADLIKAAFVTPFWGGSGGSRPAILISADAGRGSGKTTLASHIGQLTGGTIDLSAGEDASQMKQRLLSSEGLAKRVAVLDNVKSNRFGWAEFEAMITAPTISGKRLYHGEASRPNNLLWIITLNGPSLSKDIAQRCAIIKLARPKQSGTWAEDTRQFIEDNREAIIADCIAFLRSERFQLTSYSRWASWEKDVIERLPEPSDAQAAIMDRQKAADVEDEESKLIEEYFSGKLQRLGYDIDDSKIFVPSKVCADWYCEITKERLTTTSVTRRLKQAISEESITQIQPSKSRAHGRGFVWWGASVIPSQTTITDIETRIENEHRTFT